MYSAADHIVTVTHSFKNDLVKKGINQDKISVVLNGVNFKHFSPRPPKPELQEKYNCSDTFNIGYIGTLGMAHSIGTILEAAYRLEINGFAGRFKFFIVGDGAERSSLESQAESLGLQNVNFTGLIPKDEIADYWSLYEQPGLRLPMLASPFYHDLHIVQLQIMHKITGKDIYKTYYQHWVKYKTSSFKRRRAFVMKALFKIFYY